MTIREMYQGKKCFITGITGFKGSWLALLLNELGAEVYGLGLPQLEDKHIFNQAKVEEFATVFYVDLTNSQRADSIAYAHLVDSDYVFHLAAQSLVSVGKEKPYATMLISVMGTCLVHELLLLSEKKVNFLNVTSNRVYEPKQSLLKENDLLRGQDPYSLSKSFSDQLSTMYRTLTESSVTIQTVRAGNIVGGGDYGDGRLANDIIKAIFEKAELFLEKPNAISNHQYVLDCVMQYAIINAFPKVNSINIGPEVYNLSTNEQFVKSFQEKIPFKYNKKGSSPLLETTSLLLDNSLYKGLYTEKQYAPKIDNVITHTLEWYNNLYKGEDMQVYSKAILKPVIEFYETQWQKVK